MRNIVMVISFLAFVAMIWIVYGEGKTRPDWYVTYEQACVAAKGKPAYNGRNWECLK